MTEKRLAYTHWIETRDGWHLEVTQHGKTGHSRRPLLLIPGYGMNSFILSFHPRGRSMVDYFSDAGFEVWTANLRGQGKSLPRRGCGPVGLENMALIDLPRVIEFVRNYGGDEREQVDLVGCSLGGALAYTHLAFSPTTNRVARLVAMGSPLRWLNVHPIVRAAFFFPRLAGAVRVRGTRQLARRMLPVAKRVPRLLSIYMNARHIDLDDAETLTMTVDDPHREVTREIAEWIKNKDLMIRGRNITRDLATVDRPLFAIYGNGDGIVPPACARSVIDAIGSTDKVYLEVGTSRRPFSHADLFISDNVEQEVFARIEAWLRREHDAQRVA